MQAESRQPWLIALRWGGVLAAAAMGAIIFPSAPTSGVVLEESPRLMEITLEVPATTYLPGSFMRCIARLESREFGSFPPLEYNVTYRSVCYDSDSALPPPPPLPYHEEPSYLTLTGQIDEQDVLTVTVLPCIEFVPGYYALEAKLVIDLIANTGTVEILEDRTSPTDCQNVTPLVGDITVTPLALGHNEDGDYCSDWQEFSQNASVGGFNDPFNPNDAGCQAMLASEGLYYISHRLQGGWRHCAAVVDVSTKMRVYCYTDIVGIEVNPDGYPGVFGDSKLPKPLDDTVAFGDVNAFHTELAIGTENGSALHFEGCFEDEDGTDPLGHVYVKWDWDTQAGAGLADMDVWTTKYGGLTLANCRNGTLGSPDEEGDLLVEKVATTAQLLPGNPFGDSDGDGVPDNIELGDDDVCGLRDPFNPYDYYDVSVPRDGVIDLSNDILGVILEYSPGGYAGNGGVDHTGNTFKINYDRPGVIFNSAGHWNRGSPDRVIDLSNDILGVILQYNPGGCPAID